MESQQQPASTLRQILVPLDSKITARNTIETAFVIAKSLNSHVKVLLIGKDPTRDENKYPPNVIDMEPPEGTLRVRRDEEIARQRWQEIRRIVDGACARHHCQEASPSALSATIATETGNPATVIGRHGRLSDLIVFPKPTLTTRMSSSVRCSSALFETGRPIVVTPSASGPGFGRRIAIAWDNTIEASRAVAAALPFLRRAEAVVVLMAEEAETSARPAGDILEYLATHGIDAETRTIQHSTNQPVGGRRLLEECTAIRADLLVAGAPRRKRGRDRALDKATLEIVEGTAIPVLMAR